MKSPTSQNANDPLDDRLVAAQSDRQLLQPDLAAELSIAMAREVVVRERAAQAKRIAARRHRRIAGLTAIAVDRRELSNHRRAVQRRGAATQRLASDLMAGADRPGDAASAGSEQVLEALDRLGAEDREIVTLTYWDGLSSEQVGLAIGTSAASVRKRLQRVRSRLGEALEPGRNDGRLVLTSGGPSAGRTSRR